MRGGAILTSKATGAQSRDRAALPRSGRVAACGQQLGWHPWDQEAEMGRGEREEGLSKEPFLSEKQEETFAGGEQRETGPARVEGAGGAGGGWVRPRSQAQQSVLLRDSSQGMGLGNDIRRKEGWGDYRVIHQ